MRLGEKLLTAIMHNDQGVHVSLNVNEYQYLSEAYNALLNSKGYHEKLEELESISCNNYVMAVYTYNNLGIIKVQFDALKQFGQPWFNSRYLVYVDNSTDDGIANDIEEFAGSIGAHYVRIPHFPELEGENIYHHPKSIELSWYLYLRYIQTNFFWMLDHDVIPCKQIDFAAYQEKIWSERLAFLGVYGLQDYDLKEINKSFHYPWPGFGIWDKNWLDKATMAFDYLCFYDKDLGFCELDTGGTFILANHFQDGINAQQINVEAFEVADDYVEVFDGTWIHLRDTSDWSGKHNYDEKRQVLIDCIGYENFPKNLRASLQRYKTKR